MTPADLTATIEHALLTVLEVEDFELTESFDGRGIDVSGDDWTWHVEDGLSYLAIDDEPDAATAYPTAIEKNLTGPVIVALQEIDPAKKNTLTLIRAKNKIQIARNKIKILIWTEPNKHPTANNSNPPPLIIKLTAKDIAIKNKIKFKGNEHIIIRLDEKNQRDGAIYETVKGIVPECWFKNGRILKINRIKRQHNI